MLTTAGATRLTSGAKESCTCSWLPGTTRGGGVCATAPPAATLSSAVRAAAIARQRSWILPIDVESVLIICSIIRGSGGHEKGGDPDGAPPCQTFPVRTA